VKICVCDFVDTVSNSIEVGRKATNATLRTTCVYNLSPLLAFIPDKKCVLCELRSDTEETLSSSTEDG